MTIGLSILPGNISWVLGIIASALAIIGIIVGLVWLGIITFY